MDIKESYPTIKDFVLQQAHEKAFEALVLGLKDYEKEKARIFDQRRDGLNVEFQKKIKEKQAAKRIQKSTLINSSRMDKMQARHKFLLKIVENVQLELSNNLIGNKESYRKLLKNLIIEGLIRMLEPIVYVRCLKRDQDLVNGLLAECAKDFTQLIEHAGIEKSVGQIDLKIDRRYFLEERKIIPGSTQRVQKSQENNKCFGGVILTNQEGVIVCKNTIDSRVELVYQHMLPAIRNQLFV